MGSLSKRGIEEFGAGMKTRIGDVRKNVGRRLDDYSHRIESRGESEGHLTRSLEHLTAALPSSTWLVLAGVSIIGSIALQARKKPEAANFVGMWAPTFLILGIYNKLVKVIGSDRHELH